MKTYQTDIAIIGGGGAGLTAAVAALDCGARNIIVIEKASRLGGNAVIPFGIFATDSYLQKYCLEDVRKDDVFHTFMNYSHYRADARLVSTLMDYCAKDIEWLESKGIKFDGLVPHGCSFAPNTYHRIAYTDDLDENGFPVGIGNRMVHLFADICREKGVTFLMETQVKELIRNEEGRVCGLKAEDKDDTDVLINAKSIIICTGGFSGNIELIRKYYPDYDPKVVPAGGVPQMGEGIAMAQKVGAALDGMMGMEWGAFFTGTHLLSLLGRRQYSIWFNKNAERYMPESNAVSTEIANATYRQPDHTIFVLYDETVKKLYTSVPISMYEEMNFHHVPDAQINRDTDLEAAFERDIKICEETGKGKRCQTLEEAAEFTGIPTEKFMEMVEEYNYFCDKGHDDTFAKDPHYMSAVRNAPFYIFRCTPAITQTHGGIKINPKMEVISTEGKVIPGLYAAGVETGGWEGDCYNMLISGHSFGFTVAGGRIAGEQAASE